MSQQNMDLPESMRSSSTSQSVLTTRINTEVAMFIVAGSDDLRFFNEATYEQLNSTVAIAGGVNLITEDDLLRYFITALKVRVEQTTLPREKKVMRRSGITVFEPWALPIGMAYIVNSIGQTLYGPSSMLVYPVWDQAGDEFCLEPAEQQRITRLLRSYGSLGVRFASALESNRDGVPRVMVLTRVEDAIEGEWVSHEVFTAIDAITASVIGLTPGAQYPVPANPFWVPPYRVGDLTVARYKHDAVNLVVQGKTR